MARLLLVDDDIDILQALEFFLKRNRFDVIPVSNGSLVEATVLQTAPDIILMDISLNGHDGRLICKRLRDDLQVSAPIILFSAMEEYKKSAHCYGASGFMDKPIEVKHLVENLLSYLDSGSAN